jgi:hypothetical protein
MSHTADVSGRRIQIVIYPGRKVVTTFRECHRLQWYAIIDTVTAWRQTDGDTWSRSGAAC